MQILRRQTGQTTHDAARSDCAPVKACLLPTHSTPTHCDLSKYKIARNFGHHQCDPDLTFIPRGQTSGYRSLSYNPLQLCHYFGFTHRALPELVGFDKNSTISCITRKPYNIRVPSGVALKIARTSDVL